MKALDLANLSADIVSEIYWMHRRALNAAVKLLLLT